MLQLCDSLCTGRLAAVERLLHFEVVAQEIGLKTQSDSGCKEMPGYMSGFFICVCSLKCVRYYCSQTDLQEYWNKSRDSRVSLRRVCFP
jgi:hypothetical protein